LCIPFGSIILDWLKEGDLKSLPGLIISVVIAELGVFMIWYSYIRVERRYYHGDYR